jgi:hypothetical protein
MVVRDPRIRAADHTDLPGCGERRDVLHILYKDALSYRADSFRRPPGVVMHAVRLLVLAGALALVAVSGAAALDIISEPKTLPDGIVGQPYHHEFEGEEGCEPSYKFEIRSDSQVPPGLVLETNGELEGTPTQAGTWNFWVHLSDGQGAPWNGGAGACNSTPSQADFFITILPRLEIESNLVGSLAGQQVNTQLTAKGGAPLYWSVAGGSLPPGITLSQKGVLSGGTSALGTYTFTVRVQDDGPKRVTTKDVRYFVASPLAAAAAAARAAEVGRPFTLAPGVTGGIPPLRFAVAAGASLPGGLSLNPTTGAIGGTPTAAGRFTLPLTVADALGTTIPVTASITVAPRLAIATSTLAAPRVGRAYRAKLAAQGGVAPIRWRIVRGTLPRGIRFNTATGAFTGTARAARGGRITFRATDSLGATATKTVVLRAT